MQNKVGSKEMESYEENKRKTAIEDLNVDLTKLDLILNKYKDTKGNIIAVLQQAQDVYGYLALPMLDYIAHEMGMKSAKVYGIATFYSYFNIVPKENMPSTFV